MKRFLVFPLVLGIAGAFFCPGYYVESVLALWPAYVFPFSVSAWEKFTLYLIPVALYGAVTGIATGLILATWDLLRNCRKQSAVARLPANIFWCSCYALLFIAANRVLAGLALGINHASLTVGNVSLDSGVKLFWWLSALLLNLTALLWAAIRSVTTYDVLTPRVLRAKLRQRARLQ